MKLKLLLISVMFVSIAAFSQEIDSSKAGIFPVSAPIPIELFTGNKGFAFQLIVSKQFSQGSKFAFFNVTNFAGNYEQINQSTNFLSQSFITAELWKGISAAAGLSAVGSSNSPLEVRPTLGLQYLFINHNVVFLILPRFDLTQSHNFETFAVLEYKPSLSKHWGVYTRLQGLYNYNIKFESHEISEINFRIGLAYKNLQFGLGSSHTFYGPEAINVNNYGLFLKTDLF